MRKRYTAAEKERALRRVRALRALAASDPPPSDSFQGGEAISAMKHAFALEEKYGLKERDIQAPPPDPKPVVHAPETWTVAWNDFGRVHTFSNGMRAEVFDSALGHTIRVTFQAPGL
jgi:hypothetical protein